MAGLVCYVCESLVGRSGRYGRFKTAKVIMHPSSDLSWESICQRCLTRHHKGKGRLLRAAESNCGHTQFTQSAILEFDSTLGDFFILFSL